jgi:hypothetical protein
MDDISYKEIDLFVREELSQHGEWLVDRFVEALEKGGHMVSGDLIDSFDYRTGSEGGVQTLTVSFFTYGRITEAAARKRKQKQAWAKKNGEIWGKKNHRPKKVQWYNKNRYGGYGRLIRRLTAGMSDAELQRIRGILNQAKAEFAQNS